MAVWSFVHAADPSDYSPGIDLVLREFWSDVTWQLFQLARKEREAVAELEQLGWIPFMLAVPRYNKRMLKEKITEMKMILSNFAYPYNRRIAGGHGRFSTKDYEKWLKQADIEDLAQALRRLAQLNQPKAYLFWESFDFHIAL